MARLDLTEADGGRSYPAALGDLLVVRLAETPSSGYRWQLDAVETAVLAPSGDSFRPEHEGLGGVGTRQLRFTATGAGRTALRLVLRRGWETAERPARRFEVTIHVGAAGSTGAGPGAPTID
ncbi:protease inhibitor I42 family protein [Plantactinospora endophytica]|uniref:Peptidase inhibitor I42 n=1 Tax=Plantactinospora endophytica TaxID=673535 RepID=A0ABQ4E980_9ACTN|nr:protease inhibitor I42 family protein [Plantactinospora endophytica]GIG91236.1 peptidase inhibitor I42 [Plantactinospora endophytica]